MSIPPRLAVLAVLAAGGAAFGGYYLWPTGRHVTSCAPVHAPVPSAAQKALAAYAGRIRHDVERSGPRGREETWSDPLTGAARSLGFVGGRLTFAYGTVPTSGAPRSVWVDYATRDWASAPLKLPGAKSLTPVANAAAEAAQVNRDDVARGKASIVGKELVDGRQTLHLRQTVHLPKPRLHAIGGITRRVRIPPQPPLHVDTWVDPLTYVMVRTRVTVRSASSVTVETWLPRTPANVAAARIVIPDGFRHQLQQGRVLTSFVRVSGEARCAQP
jgi:hypothetical protein